MKRIADSTVRRLSLYLRFLEEFEREGRATISSGELATSGGTTSAQVRKDLSSFGSFGKRGMGYSIRELTDAIREILGLAHDWRVVIVGAGKIGAALAQYAGFRDRGFHVVGVFDSDPRRIGLALDGLTVADAATLEADVRQLQAEMAVIAVPADAAQAVVDRVVMAGIHAILDFSTASIAVPPSVTLRTMNVAVELEILSFALTNR